VKLVQDTGPFSPGVPNPIAEDLLLYNRHPCLLFVRWGPSAEAINREANRLQLQSVISRIIADLLKHLNSTEQAASDIVPISALNQWYQKYLQGLTTQPKSDYLFDPTKLAAGILKHLGSTLKTKNRYDLNARQGNATRYMLLCMITDWADEISASIQVGAGEETVKCILQLANL